MEESSGIVTAVSLTTGGLIGQIDVVIVTSSKEFGQGGLEIVQRKIFAPTDNPVTVVFGLLMFPKVPVPEIIVHVPVPVEGELAYKATFIVLHNKTESAPAFAVVGLPFRVTLTSSIEIQGPFVIVHLKIYD